MGVYKSYKRRFHLKNARLKKYQKNEQLNKEEPININEEEPININEEAPNNIINEKAGEVPNKRMRLISTIQQLPDKDIHPTSNLISIMRYPRGTNEGNIISPYLQQKAYDYLNQSFYKHHSTHQFLKDSNSKLEKNNKKLHQKNQTLIKRTQSLGAKVQHLQSQKSQHIAEIRSLVRRSNHITDTEFRKKIKSIFKINNREYTSNTIWLATSISQVGQTSLRSTVECMRLVYEFLIGEPPQDWLTVSSLCTWHQDISELHFNEQIHQVANAPVFGIMVDESTRGQVKNFVLCYQFWDGKKQLPVAILSQLQDIPKCNAEIVSDTVIKNIQECGLDFKKCLLWVTDNTAYMSGDKKGAVVLYNKKTSSNSLRVGCGLHIVQIIMNHFEQEAFGKLSNNTGFSRHQHPYNLLYLAWKLHDGYDSSDKDKPLNINSQIIKDLYNGLLGYHYNQYQLPLRSRWGYELRTAKQFLDRHKAHVEFANWFIGEMECHNTPKSYLNDWYLFQSWLLDSKLNIQIKCLVTFAEHFYEPLMQFIAGQDTVARIYQNGQLATLPPGRRAHEMSDKVYEWHKFLQNIAKNFEMFFADELLEALDVLSSEEFGVLFDNLEKGIIKALEYFEKWFLPWLHLPLVVCRLGGNNAKSFASSFYHVILKRPWIKLPNDLELRFAEELENDLKNGIMDSFGLQELLLQDNNFLREFEQFCVDDKSFIYNFPDLYNFVKTRIYFIIIHQQQVEGLFNKLDLKTHPNMSLAVKQSKLRLSSNKIVKENYSDGLKKIRSERNSAKKIPLQEIQLQQFGSVIVVVRSESDQSGYPMNHPSNRQISIRSDYPSD